MERNITAKFSRLPYKAPSFTEINSILVPLSKFAPVAAFGWLTGWQAAREATADFEANMMMTFMNPGKAVAWVCGAGLAVLLAGCGGSSSSDATISGTVSGLAANASVVLTNNGTESITVSSNGSFSFAHSVASQASYSVQVTTQPAGQSCSVSYGSGVVDYSGDSIKNVTVVCSNDAPIFVETSGLASGNSVVFSLTQQNDPATLIKTTVSADGVATPFTGSSGAVVLPLGSSYAVAIEAQPATQVCSYSTAAGATPPSGGVVNSSAITVVFVCK